MGQLDGPTCWAATAICLLQPCRPHGFGVPWVSMVTLTMAFRQARGLQDGLEVFDHVMDG